VDHGDVVPVTGRLRRVLVRARARARMRAAAMRASCAKGRKKERRGEKKRRKEKRRLSGWLGGAVGPTLKNLDLLFGHILEKVAYLGAYARVPHSPPRCSRPNFTC
jgi:hypothetical protein